MEHPAAPHTHIPEHLGIDDSPQINRHRRTRSGRIFGYAMSLYHRSTDARARHDNQAWCLRALHPLSRLDLLPHCRLSVLGVFLWASIESWGFVRDRRASVEAR